MRISRHSKERIVERDEGVMSFSEAKRVAKQAFISGKTVNHYQTCPKFYGYLRAKAGQTNDCSVRVYRGNIYIWRGRRHTLVTAHPIPNRFKEEVEAMKK